MTRTVTRLYVSYGRWLRRDNPLLCDKDKILIDADSPHAAVFCLHRLCKIFCMSATFVYVFCFGNSASRQNSRRDPSR